MMDDGLGNSVGGTRTDEGAVSMALESPALRAVAKAVGSKTPLESGPAKMMGHG